jgi:hypothetical protein
LQKTGSEDVIFDDFKDPFERVYTGKEDGTTAAHPDPNVTTELVPDLPFSDEEDVVQPMSKNGPLSKGAMAPNESGAARITSPAKAAGLARARRRRRRRRRRQKGQEVLVDQGEVASPGTRHRIRHRRREAAPQT